MATQSKWAARVAEWRSSRLTAKQFSEGKDFTPGTLQYWASRLRRQPPARAAAEVRIAKVVPAGSRVHDETPIVLEIAGVRIAVRRGFDRSVLREVLDTLGSRGA